MVSKDVEKEEIDLLVELFGLKVYYFDYIYNPSKSKSRLNNNYSKIRLWQLTNYKKMIYYDSDFLILQSHDQLCTLPSRFAAVENYNSFKGKYTKGTFNGGMFTFIPSDETFQSLYSHSQQVSTTTGGDQQMFNSFFPKW